MRIIDRAGHGHHLAPHFCGQPGRDQRAGLGRGFHHQHGLRQGGDNAVAAREIAGQRAGVEWEFAHNQAALGNLVGQIFVGRRINAVDARAPHRNRAARAGQCTLMRRCIDAGSHARHHGDFLLADGFAEIAGNAQGLRRGMAAAHHGHRRPLQQGGIAAQKQHRRRRDALGEHEWKIFIAQQH